MSDTPVSDQSYKEFLEARALLQMDQDESLNIFEKIAVWFKLLLLNDKIRALAQANLRGERMSLMDVRQSKTLTVKRYGDLFTEWYKVNREDAKDQFPFKGDEKGLIDLLENWENNSDRKSLLARWEKGERDRWLEERSEWEVFNALVEGVEAQEEDDAKLDRLFENFKSVGADRFKYTMEATNSDQWLKDGGGGDCNTLMHAFRDICQNMLGIQCDKQSSVADFPNRFLTPERRTIDGVTGNVDGKDCKYWVFQNHYWAKCPGKTYDVLFGEPGAPNTASWLKIANSERDEVWIFGEGPAQVKVKLINENVVKGRYQQVD
jgi:hypothetical protein